MRWDNLRHGGADQAALFGTDVVARRFDTPEFAGMQFYEVRARSILNEVPAASQVPFRWTINPYRGCSHGCTYCLAGDTQVIRADGRTADLAELGVGDRIYGTVRHGAHRRYVPTEVQAQWSTVKLAYRVLLAGGTDLVASGDHRFLTVDGWKRVVKADGGTDEPEGLAVDDTLVGLVPQDSDRLRVAAIHDLGVEMVMYDITTGTGDFVANGVVSHNCFARQTHTYLDLDAGHDFDSRIIVKVNAPELLRRELAAPTWSGEHIAMGTNTDPYQRAEGKYRLMPGILAALRDARNPFSILTKGTLVLRDLDLLREAAEVTDVAVNVSVGFVDKSLWRQIEPGTPSPAARLDVCRRLTDVGIGCGVLMAPILPYLTDTPEQLDRAVGQIAEAGATSVIPIVLHLRPGSREWFLGWLARDYPDLVSRYERLYARGAYAPRSYQRRTAELVRELADRHGIGARPPDRTRLRPERPEAVARPACPVAGRVEQLRLL